MQHPESGGTWRMLVAMALSGTIGLFVVESGQAPQDVVLFRCLVGGVALLAWVTWQRDWQRLTPAAWGWLALGGGALILNWQCLFSAYRYSSISIATVVYHTQPFFLLLLTALTQRERLPLHRLPWLVLAFVGVALTSGLGGETATALAGPELAVGIGLAMSAALLYAVATLATRKLTGIPPAQIAGLQMLLGGLVMLPLAHPPLAQFPLKTWGALLTLGLVHTGLMYTLMYAAFQRLPALSIATLSFIYPLVAVVIDLLVYRVTLQPVQIAGMATILLAVVANQRGWMVRIHNSSWRQS